MTDSSSAAAHHHEPRTPQVVPAGDHAFLLTLPSNAAVHALAATLRSRWQGQIEEIVPGDDSLLVVWPEHASVTPHEVGQLRALLDDSLNPTTANQPADQPRTLIIPVHYDGPDLDQVAAAVGLTPDELIARHTAPTYTAAFIGFAPGFAYLRGGDPLLNVPRRAAPRTQVPAGTVAIAAGYSAIYPTASPGGWQLLGHTDLRLFDPTRNPPILIEPATEVRFEAIR